MTDKQSKRSRGKLEFGTKIKSDLNNNTIDC